jgi:phosphohistidine swiveling domain-containing protein
MKYPETLEEFQKELPIHSAVGRSDPGFRLNIALSQMGNLASHFTHDSIENPGARPYGTREGEVLDAGHAMLQLMTYIVSRGINLQEAANVAMQGIRDYDFQRRSAENETVVRGIIASKGITDMKEVVFGTAFVDKTMKFSDSKFLKDTILVTTHPFSDHRLTKFGGVITDQGGLGCHAAIVSREHRIPRIVGTGNATDRIKTGDLIVMDLRGEMGIIIPIEEFKE